MEKTDAGPPMTAGRDVRTIASPRGVSNGEKPGGTIRASPTTRETIFQAVADLHYPPNNAQDSQRKPFTNQLGFYNEGGWMDLRMPFYAQIVTGIYEGCYATGRSLLLHTPLPNATPEVRHANLASGTMDGLIVKVAVSDPLVALLAASPLGTVAVVDALPGIPSVVSDDAAGGRAIAEHLANLGHRRVFFQRSDHRHSSVERRLAALQEEGSPWSLTVEVGEVPDSEPGGMCAELQRALQRPRCERPTAVVCWNDRNAASVLRACRDQGLRVPSDLAVVGYDDGANDGGGIAEGRRITSVRAEWGAVAREAVYCLVTLLEGGEVPPETVLPSRLITGDTT